MHEEKLLQKGTMKTLMYRLKFSLLCFLFFILISYSFKYIITLTPNLYPSSNPYLKFFYFKFLEIEEERTRASEDPGRQDQPQLGGCTPLAGQFAQPYYPGQTYHQVPPMYPGQPLNNGTQDIQCTILQ